MRPAPPGRGRSCQCRCGSRADRDAGRDRPPGARPGGGCAVTITLCLSLVGTIGVMPLRAMPGSRIVVRAMALVRFADDNPECSPALGPGQPRHRAALIRAPGADRASTGPDMACLLAYREFPVRHLPVSSWWRFPRVRPADPHPGGQDAGPGTACRVQVRRRHQRSRPGRHGAAGAASGDRGHDGIRLVSHIGPGRQDSLARGSAPGASGGIPRGCVLPGAAGQDVAAGLAVRGCKACGEIGGTGGTWDAVTVPACRGAGPGTG